MELAGIDVPVAAGPDHRSPGAADRPLNGVLRSSVAERLGLAPLRPVARRALDYLERAGLLAATARRPATGP